MFSGGSSLKANLIGTAVTPKSLLLTDVSVFSDFCALLRDKDAERQTSIVHFRKLVFSIP